MTRQEKSQVIEELTAQLADNTNIYIADISGLNAGNTSDLRRALPFVPIHKISLS